MKINDIIKGFSVTKIRPVAEQSGTLIEFEHIKTGTPLIWLKRQEENKTFCISFKTIPEDDTGVFHILEHSVLNGSKRYPVKEPFVDMIKNSLNTFLNAMTYPDKTVYPVASRNEKDFENLMRVYLDAVFYPAIYNSREIFDQEGWHYEPMENGGYFRNGVVLNEMKGAFSSVDTVMIAETDKLLFPDNCYKYESGGHPDSIHNLTYEQFIESHKKYYHPSNSKIFLDGDISIEKTLEIIDKEYLSNFEKSDCDFKVLEQTAPVLAESTVHYYAGENDTNSMCHLVKSCVAGKITDKERIFAAGLLSDYLAGNNDAPLRKAILENELAQNVEVMINNEVYQPYLIFVYRNMSEKNKDSIEKLSRDVFESIVKNGIDKERMNALIDNTEFLLREQDFGSMPTGVGLALNVFAVWNYNDDPINALENQEMIKSIRQKLDSGYFEKLIKEIILDNNHQATLMLIPDNTLEAKNIAREKADIEKAIGNMSAVDIEEINKLYENLSVRQNTPDSEENIKKVPMLKLSDVDTTPTKNHTEICNDGKVIFHTLPSNGIQYVNLYFPIGEVSKESLPQIAVATSLLGDLATEKYSSQRLSELLLRDLGKFDINIMPVQDKDAPNLCKAYIHVTFSVLEEKSDKAISLIEEILLHTRFDDKKRISDLLAQMTEYFRQQFIESGNALAINHSNAGLCASGVVLDGTKGFACYEWLKSAQKSYEENADKLSASFEKICKKLFIQNGLMVSITGKRDTELAKKLTDIFPVGDDKSEICSFTPNDNKSVGIEIPAPVSYGVLNSHYTSTCGKITGTHLVLSHILGLDYLWQEVRVKGGAYGCGIRFTDNGNMVFYSYRDPDSAHSLEIYRNTCSFIKNYVSGNPDLTGVILGTIGSVAPLRSIGATGAFEDKEILFGNTYEDRCRVRQEILSTTPQKLLELCDDIEKAINNSALCVAGGSSILDNCNLKERKVLL